MSTTTTSSAAVSGRFEVSQEKFHEMTKDRAPDVLALDLKEVLPDFATGAARLPRLVERAWRRSCDEVIAENRGMYCVRNGTAVQLFFFELTGGVAKAKVSLIRDRIPRILDAAKKDESILDAPLPQAAKSQPQPQGETALAKLVKEGLPENPSLELLRLWVSRVTQGMVTSGQKVPLTRDMIDAVGKADVVCLPLWSLSGEMIVGSAVRSRTALPQQQWNPGEPFRHDLVALFGAAFQMYSMQSKGQVALVAVPVRASSLVDKEVSELYMGFLRRLSPEVRKCLILEVTGVPKDSAPASLTGAVEAARLLVRAVMFETGLLAYADFARHFPRLHAAGFDSGDAHLPDAEQARLMKKYAEHYQKAEGKAYVKNVSAPAVFDAAAALRFAYVSGPVIRPAQKACFAAQKLPAAEIRK
jgi:hypothetical protein